MVITDFPENLRKAREIVAALDVTDSVIESFTLQNLSAVDAQEALRTLGAVSYTHLTLPTKA